jgi:hypothetical protein
MLNQGILPFKKGDPDPNQFNQFSATTDSTKNVEVPRDLWKVVLGFSPENKSNIPDIYFAWLVPNNSYNIKKTINYADSNGISDLDNRKWNDAGFITTIQSLENRLNNISDNNLPQGSSYKYDFLSNITNIQIYLLLPNQKRMVNTIYLLPFSTN